MSIYFKKRKGWRNDLKIEVKKFTKAWFMLEQD